MPVLFKWRIKLPDEQRPSPLPPRGPLDRNPIRKARISTDMRKSTQMWDGQLNQLQCCGLGSIFNFEHLVDRGTNQMKFGDARRQELGNGRWAPKAMIAKDKSEVIE
jgi:hypothetical protein